MATRFLDWRSARRIGFFFGCGIFVVGRTGDVRAETPYARDIAIYDFGLTFSSVPGKTYRTDVKDDFVLANWTLLEDQVSATGISTAITDLGAGILARRAYRVSVEP